MSRLYDVLDKLSETAIVDYGTTNGWNWIKYADGRYEAEMLKNEGNFIASTNLFTVEGNNKMYVTDPIPETMPSPPHSLVSGAVVAQYESNSKGYGMMFATTNYKFQLGRVTTDNTFEFTNVYVYYKVVGGKWK